MPKAAQLAGETDLISRVLKAFRRTGSAFGEASVSRSREDQAGLEHSGALATDQTGLGFWEVNLATDELFLDSRSRSFLGVPRNEPVPLQSCLERIHPDDRELILADFENSVLSGVGTDWNHEFRIAHPEGGMRWLLGFGQIERDANGRALRVNGIAVDIMNSRRLDLSHRSSEERYRKLFESISDALVIVNMEGRILECNQSYLAMIGYTQEELSRLTYQDLTPEKWHAFEASIVSEQIIPHGHSATYEKEYMRKDGTVMPVELRTFLIRDARGNPAEMWAIIRDISERKASEIMMLKWNKALERRVAERTSALRQSETRFRQLAEATSEGIAICQKGILLDGNLLLARMFGYDLAEMIGKPLGDLAADSFRKPVFEQLLSGVDGSCEFTAVRADGSNFPVEAHAKTAAHQARKVRIIAIRDLTSAKATETWIHAQQAKLDEFQRLALISEIAAGIIHQVGQPLTSMGANIMTAVHGLESCKNAPCHSIGYVRDVEADVARMRDIVLHMRSLGNPERAERKACDLNQIIKDVVPNLLASSHSTGVVLNFRPHAGLPRIKADSVQLSQVVLNLGKNALEACAGKSNGRRVVNILTHAIGREWVEMSMEDSGTGISPHAQENLFTPFFSTKSDGLGVGLRLCRTIIEAHGGSITCFNNANGIGATFQVKLPAQLDPHPAGK